MIINSLNIILELLVRILNGLISLIEDISFLFFKIILTSSPLWIALISSSILFGIKGFFINLIITIVLTTIGYKWALHNRIVRTDLTKKIWITVIILDLIAVSPLLMKTEYWNKVDCDNLKLNSDAISDNDIRGGAFIETLKKGEKEVKIRSLNEIANIKYRKAIPYIIDTLTHYYKENYNNDNEISIACIKALIALNAKESCSILYKIQVSNPTIRELAIEATTKICVDSETKEQ